MTILNKLERKAGWLAIPGLIRIIMCFQVLVWVLLIVQQARSGSGDPTPPQTLDEALARLPGLLPLLYLDIEKVMAGEVWRLVTFVLLPPTFKASGIIIMLFAFFFTCFLADLLEQAWGAFRLTLYVYGWMLGTVLGAILVYSVGTPGQDFGLYLLFDNGRILFGEVLLFAVAVYHPNYEVRLLGVIR